MTFPTEIMNDFWRDVVAIIGCIGAFLTIVGLAIAWRQMRKQASASQAAIRALNKVQGQYNRFIAGHAFKLLSEARASVQNGDLAAASLRLGDLGEWLAQITGENYAWMELMERVNGIGHSLIRQHTAGKPISASLSNKWTKLDTDLRTSFSRYLSPFSDEETTESNNEN